MSLVSRQRSNIDLMIRMRRSVVAASAAFLCIPILSSGVISAAPKIGEPPAAAIYSTPGTPTNVTALRSQGGITVSWGAPTATPAVTAFVVHAGPGSCPVIVGPGARSALMPLVAGQRKVTPVVEAVNAYGLSPLVATAKSLTVTGSISARYRVAQFLQFSDFHGAIAPSSTRIGAARMVTAFNQDRVAVQPTFTVASGDNIGGSPPLSAVFEEVPTIKAMNLMRVDVSGFGNHEHDRPLDHLRRMMDLSRFDWVASNYSDLSALQGKRSSAERFVLRQRDGITVGFVGMNTEDTEQVVTPGNLSYGKGGNKSLTITPSVRPVQRDVNAARKAGAQIVVVLLHQGWNENRDGEALGRLPELASQLKGADVIYGGHTHQQFESVINKATLVQVPNSGSEYSQTQVCLDTKTGKVLGSAAKFVTAADLAQTQPDRRTAAMIERYQEQLAERLDERVGVVDMVFPRGGTPAVERSGQTPLGNLMADAVCEKYGTQLAILNGGGIRDTMPAAGYTPRDPSLRRPVAGSSGPYDVTLGDVVAVFPFGNDAVTTEMTGAQIWKALENGVSGYPSEGRFPQVSGLAFSFNPTQPEGSRIRSVTLADGTPIAADNTRYTVATSDFMLYGGDGYVDVFNPLTGTIREPFIDAVIERLRRDLALGRATSDTGAGTRITVLR